MKLLWNCFLLCNTTHDLPYTNKKILLYNTTQHKIQQHTKEGGLDSTHQRGRFIFRRGEGGELILHDEHFFGRLRFANERSRANLSSMLICFYFIVFIGWSVWAFVFVYLLMFKWLLLFAYAFNVCFHSCLLEQLEIFVSIIDFCLYCIYVSVWLHINLFACT